jgi:thiol-disulfide isomerase/thioredoxin
MLTGVLTVGVIIAVALTILNLLVSFAIIRRLRGVESRGGDHAHQGDALTDDLPAVGTRVGAFSVPTVDGDQLDDQTLAGEPVLAAFLSPTCSPCKDLVAALAARPDPDLARTILFVDGDEDAKEFAESLRVHGRVALVDSQGPVGVAFGGVEMFPIVLTVERGVITAADIRLPASKVRRSPEPVFAADSP